MKIKFGSGLLLLNLLVIALIMVIILSPSSLFRVILGLPLVLFFPGYALVMALFPERVGLSAIERIALSFGLSIAVAPLIGLILNYTPWGIKLEPVLYSLATFIFIMSVIATLRRVRIPKQARFSIESDLELPRWHGSVFDKVLSVLLIVSILGALGMLGYVLASPKVGESFTEFYILGHDGKAQDYPTEFVMADGRVILVRYGDSEMQEGAIGYITLGIINQERKQATYSVNIMIDGNQVSIYSDGGEVEGIGPITLAYKEEWEHEIGFAPQHIGSDQKVDFILYKDGTPCFKEPIHLWMDVKAQD